MSKYYDKLVKINEDLDKEMLDKGVVNAEIRANDTIIPNDKTTTIVEDGNSDGNTIEIPKDSLTPDQKKEILLDKGVEQKTVDNLKDDKEIDGALDATLNNDEVKKESWIGTDLSEMDWDGPAIIVHQVPSGSGNEYYVKDGEWSTDVKNAFEFDSKEAAKEKIDELCEKGISEETMFIWSAQSKLDESDGSVKVEDDIDESVVIRMDDDDLDMHGYVSTKGGKELVLTDNMDEAQRFQHEELGQNRIEAICYKFHYDPSTFKTVSVDPRADEPYEDDGGLDGGENWISLDPMHPGATTLP